MSQPFRHCVRMVQALGLPRRSAEVCPAAPAPLQHQQVWAVRLPVKRPAPVAGSQMRGAAVRHRPASLSLHQTAAPATAPPSNPPTLPAALHFPSPACACLLGPATGAHTTVHPHRHMLPQFPNPRHYRRQPGTESSPPQQAWLCLRAGEDLSGATVTSRTWPQQRQVGRWAGAGHLGEIQAGGVLD